MGDQAAVTGDADHCALSLPCFVIAQALHRLKLILGGTASSVAIAAEQSMASQISQRSRLLIPRIGFAINQMYVNRATVLHDGDELALIPPVSGGRVADDRRRPTTFFSPPILCRSPQLWLNGVSDQRRRRDRHFSRERLALGDGRRWPARFVALQYDAYAGDGDALNLRILAGVRGNNGGCRA